LCKDGFRLLKTYDPSRAGLSTWLTIVARSTARDVLRRRHVPVTPIDAVPEALLATPGAPPDKLRLPEGLLSPRQKLVLTMLYDQDMDVAEIAVALAVDPQTVRSTHHKAMLKLREHFANEEQ
jgi:RNA polymerase sigma-70 factor (ECF subfamily)